MSRQRQQNHLTIAPGKCPATALALVVSVTHNIIGDVCSCLDRIFLSARWCTCMVGARRREHVFSTRLPKPCRPAHLAALAYPYAKVGVEYSARPAARRASVTLPRCIIWCSASARKVRPKVANSCSRPLGGAFVGLSRSSSLSDSRSFRFCSRNCRYLSRISAKGGYEPALPTGSEPSPKYCCHSPAGFLSPKNTPGIIPSTNAR